MVDSQHHVPSHSPTVCAVSASSRSWYADAFLAVPTQARPTPTSPGVFRLLSPALMSRNVYCLPGYRRFPEPLLRSPRGVLLMPKIASSMWFDELPISGVAMPTGQTSRIALRRSERFVELTLGADAERLRAPTRVQLCYPTLNGTDRTCLSRFPFYGPPFVADARRRTRSMRTGGTANACGNLRAMRMRSI